MKRTLIIQSDEEVEALLMGLCWVAQQEESDCCDAAETLIERIVSQLPEPGSGPAHRMPAGSAAAEIEAAVRSERQLRIAYQDRKGSDTRRTIWPFDAYATGPDEGLVVAWCETREDFRQFRIERMQSLETLERYPVRRQLLLARWRAQQDDGFY